MQSIGHITTPCGQLIHETKPLFFSPTSVRLLHEMGFKLFGSYNTADYFNEVFKGQNIVVEHVEWAYENIGEDQEVFHFI